MSFEAAEGAQLSSDLLLDKHIGSGSTAEVYKLKPAQGGKDKGPTQVRCNLCSTFAFTQCVVVLSDLATVSHHHGYATILRLSDTCVQT